MTYDELAVARGINRRAAVRLSQRHRLRRQPGNDGLARVWVPDDVATSPLRQTRRKKFRINGRGTNDADANDAHVDAGVTGALAVATERGERAEKQAEEANQRADVAITLADRTLMQLTDANARVDLTLAHLAEAEKRADAERALADGLRDQLKKTREQLAAAEADTKAAHDRAWASGEQLAQVERRAAADRERADRIEAQAAHEREDFLDAEARTRRELETVREHQERLRAEADSAQAELAAVRQADEARKVRGRWARIRAAWRGE